MNADLLVVLIRDIARAEITGHCTAKYLADAAELLRAGELPSSSERAGTAEGARGAGAR